MAEVLVHDIELVREDPPAPVSRVMVHDIYMTREGPPGTFATVLVHDIWVTRGYEPPRGGGGIFKRISGSWTPVEILVRKSGAWV